MFLMKLKRMCHPVIEITIQMLFMSLSLHPMGGRSHWRWWGKEVK